jgi:hypothetical protein
MLLHWASQEPSSSTICVRGGQFESQCGLVVGKQYHPKQLGLQLSQKQAHNAANEQQVPLYQIPTFLFIV